MTRERIAGSAATRFSHALVLSAVLTLRATRFAPSPGLARLLLKLYALAIIPVTLWVTGFASRLAVPLV